jgi:D-beta-D-heptose 7-phosphate kinase/D-beta-D-heptose 1-phosphate adenosyltransferase
LREIIEKLKSSKPKIAVFGDLMIDHYIFGDSERISPEAPIQVVDVKKDDKRIGGAGNVVHNLQVFGGETLLFSVVGNDENGNWLQNRFIDLGLNISGILKENGRITSIKSRVLSRGQQIVRFDNESRFDISKDIENSVISQFMNQIENIDLVLFSDYGKGFLSNSLSQKIIEISNRFGKRVLVDPKGRDYSKYRNSYLIKPNRKEAIDAFGGEIGEIEIIGKRLLDDYNFQNAIITLSEDGMSLFEKSGKVEKFPTKAKDIFDVTGAGDTVLASLGFSLASNLSLQDAIHFANSATAVAISKIGTSTVTFDEVLKLEEGENRISEDQKVKSWKELKEIVENLRKNHKRVVFTNGCFDILHFGHVKYLQKAKEFGDVLILGLNSDKSVKRLKGEARPINGENDRAGVLAGLQSIDYITIFEEDTPLDLIDFLRPDVLVKGGDYRGKEVVGSNLVKEIKLVDFLDGRSTTRIIERATSLCGVTQS